MNKRISELVEQATTYIQPTATSGEGRIFNKEKFAQLIVREVLAVQEQFIAEGHNAWHLNKPTKQHFGVEE